MQGVIISSLLEVECNDQHEMLNIFPETNS